MKAADRVPGPAARVAGRKIVLVVDDSAALRKAVGGTLREAGYDVIEAGDGQEALGKLDGERLHLVICDVNMPRMDGIAFVREMKKIAAYRFTPVIMLTTVGSEARKVEGQIAGAKAWVVKPFRPAQMMAAVAKLVLP